MGVAGEVTNVASCYNGVAIVVVDLGGIYFAHAGHCRSRIAADVDGGVTGNVDIHFPRECSDQFFLRGRK